jgi:hypothetical protein
MVGVFASILEVKGSNFTNGVIMINTCKLIEYFLLWTSYKQVENYKTKQDNIWQY